ncbi:MAG TPA: hypothetical protein ENG41_00340 [Methanomicrobia archaeon]|nr:hypothetical protein [Methanomicrobia archaeon]
MPIIKPKKNCGTRSKGSYAYRKMIREWKSHPRKMKKLYSKRSRIEAIFWSMKSRLGDIV